MADSKRCHCVKSRCLKMYCECFARGALCSGCSCADCQNIESNLDFIEKRRSDVRLRDPEAFKESVKAGAHRKGCNCKKSQCLKMYCECFKNGVACTDNCKCNECKNLVDGMSATINKDSGSVSDIHFDAPCIAPLPALQAVSEGRSARKGKASSSAGKEVAASMRSNTLSPQPTPTREKRKARAQPRKQLTPPDDAERKLDSDATHSKSTTTSTVTEDDDGTNAAVNTVHLAPPATPSLVSQHGRPEAELAGSADGRLSNDGRRSIEPVRRRGRGVPIRRAPPEPAPVDFKPAGWGHQKQRSGPTRAADSGGESRLLSSRAGDTSSGGSMPSKTLSAADLARPVVRPAMQLFERADGEQPDSVRRTSPTRLHADTDAEWQEQPCTPRGSAAPLAADLHINSACSQQPGRRPHDDASAGQPWPEARGADAAKTNLESRLDAMMSTSGHSGPPLGSYEDLHWEPRSGGGARMNKSDPGRAWDEARESESSPLEGAVLTPRGAHMPRDSSDRSKSIRLSVGASPMAELLTSSAVNRCLYPGARTPDAGLLSSVKRNGADAAAVKSKLGLATAAGADEEQQPSLACFLDSPVPSGQRSAQQTLMLSPKTPITPRTFGILAPHSLGLSPSPSAKLDLTTLLRNTSSKRAAAEGELNHSASKQLRWTDDSPSHVPLLSQLLTPKATDDWSAMMQELLVDYSQSPGSALAPSQFARGPPQLSADPEAPAAPDGPEGSPAAAAAAAHGSPLLGALREQPAPRQPKSRRMLRWGANGQCLSADAEPSACTNAPSKAIDAKAMRLQAFEYMSAAAQDC